MVRKKFYLEEALQLFNKQLEVVKKGSTKCYEVVSFSLNNIFGIQRAIGNVGKNAVVWQHTESEHIVAMYLPRNDANKFNRDLLDLIANGVINEQKFIDVWQEQNGNGKHFFPKVSNNSRTSNERRKQASYIVSDFNKGENKDSKLQGGLKKNITHRTHLITFRATGIERHKGLLIDFDGWINTCLMVEAEGKIIDINREKDIIWTTKVYRTKDGLHVEYNVYDENYNLIFHETFIDDRWTYVWYYD